MSQDRKRSFFGSLFGSKNKSEGELEAERESRQKIEERIREALAVQATPELPELAQQTAVQANTGLLEIVYSGPEPAHPRPSLQSDQPSMHQHELDSNLRIAPANERLRSKLEELGELKPEPWRIRKKAVNG